MKNLVVFFLLLFYRVACAQEDDRFPRLQKGYFAFHYDNDFFNATDRYFTQGIRLELAHPVFLKFPVSKALIGTPGFTLSGIAVEQQCFTPRSIRVDSIYKGERPYAAVMFLSFFKKSAHSTQKKIIETQLDLGMMGPCAVCEQEQKGLHRALNNIQPLGWEYQLGNDMVFNYSFLYEHAVLLKKHLSLAASGKLRAGTLYTDAAAGIHIKAGWLPVYTATPQRIQPFCVYAFLKGNVKAVGYNATLQGGLLGNNDVYVLPEKNIQRLVYTGTGGLVMAWKRISFEYTRIFISPEFDGGLSHGWGHCNVSLLF